MIFEYNSSQAPIKKTLNKHTVQDVREYFLEKTKYTAINDMTYGEIQQIFLEYRNPDGGGLLINQLEPMYIHFCRYGLWPEENQ